MALKGNLRDFSTTQLLNLINLARKTGTLTIENDDRASMAFRDGKLIDAALGDENCTLADMLHQNGRLTFEQTRIIKEKASNLGDKQVGHLLVRAGYVTQTDIIQSVRSYMLDVVYRLFAWADGLFRFEANQTPPTSRITIPIDLESVIMEGSRRLKESEKLHAEIPSLDVALAFVDQPSARLRNVNLTVEEWRVVSFVSPKNTLQQIAEANDLSEFEIRRIVYGLHQAGLVEFVPAARPGVNGRGAADGHGAADGRDQGSPPTAAVESTPETRQEKRSIVQRIIARIRGL